jgi:hypothetical protein
MTTKHIRYDAGRYKVVGSFTPLNLEPFGFSFLKQIKVSFFDMVYGSPNLPESVAIERLFKAEGDSAPFSLYQRNPNQFMTGLHPLMKDWYYGDVMGEEKCLVLVHRPTRYYISIIIFQDRYLPPGGMHVKRFIRHWMGEHPKEKGPGGDPARNTFDTSVKDGNQQEIA